MPEPHQQFVFSHFDKDGEPVFRDEVYHGYYVVTTHRTPWSNDCEPKVVKLNDDTRYGMSKVPDAIVRKILPLGMALLLTRENKDG
jgi:hypothetical protein